MSFSDVAQLIRTRQWAKNALLFGGFIFAGKLRGAFTGEAIWGEALRVFLAFACFCALSGAAYILNDWQDIECDRLHPIKKHRPLASGRVSLRQTFFLLAFLLFSGLICIWTIWQLEPRAWGFGVVALCYFALTLAYSFILKHQPIIDVLSVAAGFVARVMAGCLAVPVFISPWIILCTFNLALFVALNKRRAELTEIGQNAGTRAALKGYTPAMLDTLIAVAAGLTIIAYSLYTVEKHSDALGQLTDLPLLMSSIPFVIYGVFRFLMLAHSSSVGGEPEQMLRDRPLLINGFLWAVLVVALTVLPAVLGK